jgi:hypothetical protein
MGYEPLDLVAVDPRESELAGFTESSEALVHLGDSAQFFYFDFPEPRFPVALDGIEQHGLDDARPVVDEMGQASSVLFQ